jgi:hypothetical protein
MILLIGRGILAILLTAASSALLVSVTMEVLLPKSRRGIDFILEIAFVGFFFALAYALFLAIFIELPKIWLLTGPVRDSFLISLVPSMIGGILVLQLPALLGLAQSSSSLSTRPGEWAFQVLLGALGGFCSALWWWLLVHRSAALALGYQN